MSAYLKWYGNEVIEELETNAQEALQDAAVAVELKAQELCSVKTGNLQESIRNEVEGTIAQVGTDVEYSYYVEMGTRKQAAQPYLRPALWETPIESYFHDLL